MMFLLAIFALTQAEAIIDSSNVEAAFQFQSFISTYNRQYTAEEYETRFGIFQTNLNKIAELNAQRQSTDEATFAINKFADLSAEEFSSQYLNYRPNERRSKAQGMFNRSSVVREANWGAATRVDWRDSGAVTAVKDQGQCGSCWAFSATEEIESMWFMAGNRLDELAPQQVVSCDKTDGGCNGGDTPTAYDYVVDAGGVMLESDYPYTSGRTGRDGTCYFDQTKVQATIKGFSWAVPECPWTSPKCNNQDEAGLATALTASPISICVNAEPWQFYSGGVMTNSQCRGYYRDLDHCVQLVGYDQGASTPYWMVRNSWGTDWAYDGYIHLAMMENACGVADEATVATI